jgi:hypothetical protein
MPVFVLMNMANLYFQPSEVIQQIESEGVLSTVFLAGKLFSLFFSVFMASGIAFLIRRVKTPWTFRLMAGISVILALAESIVHSYPLWYSVASAVCCILAVILSSKFVYKF